MPYTYRGTPQEKIEEARERIGEATATTALASYLAPAENTVDQPVAQPIAQEASEPSLGKRIGDSIGDIAHQVFKGVMSFTEGLEDFAAYGIAKMAQLAGNEKLAQDAIDFANVSQTEEYDKMLADAGLGYEGSIYKDLDAKSQRIIYGIFQGVGQMAPMVVGGYVGAAAKGAAAASSGVKAAQVVGKAAEWANLGMLGASAAGNATQSAMNDTEIYDEYGNVIGHREVNFDKAIAYGLASGAVEIATEKLVGGIFEKATGKGILDSLIKRLGTSTAWRKVAQFGLNAVGEGFEEMASEAVAKTLQTIYTSENGNPHWENPDLQDVFEAGVIGTLSSALMGAGQGAVVKLSPKQYVQEKLSDITEASKRADLVAGDGKMDEKRQTQYIREQNANLRALASGYNRASEKTQNKLWETYGAELGQYINKDGTRKETPLNDGVKPIGATAVTAGALSPSLMMRSNEIANVVAREGGSVAVELNEDEQRNTRELQTVLRGVGTESGASLKMAVVEGLPAGRKAFLSGDVMYVSRDVVGDVATVARKFFHEDAHFARGSNAYKTEVAVMSALAMQEGTATRAAFLRAIDDVRAATVQEGTQGGYNIDGAILDRIESGEILLGDESLASVPAEQRSEAELAVDEVVARMFEYTYGHTDNAFGEELFHALATDNRGTAQKWLQRVKQTIKRVEAWAKTKQGTEAERAEAQKVLDGLDTLRSAQKRMTDILAESGEAYIHKRAAGVEREDDKDEPSEQVGLQENGNAAALYSLSNDKFINGVTQAEIDQYVEDAKNNNAKKDYIEYAKVSSSLEQIIGKDIEDIKEYSHALRGNDIRHIFHSHGESTNEKYPVTPADIKSIPYLVENYDYAYYRVHKGKPSLLYVKAMPGGTTYYIEQATEKYGNEKLLVNKQMIKTGIKDIPGIYVDTITKKQSIEEFHAGLEKSRKEYARDVYPQNSANTIIHQEEEEIKHTVKKSDDTVDYSIEATDSEGRTLSPEQQAFFKDSKVVDEQGNLLVVYHGTRDDFTIFDRSKTGRSNDLAKVGFWFTTSKDGAVNFSQSTWYGDSPDAHAVKSYIDIKNPKIYRTQEVDQARIDALWKEARPLRERLHEIWQNIDINGMGYSAILAFQRLVEGKTIDPSTYRLSNENYERLKDDAAEYSKAQERVKAIENEIVELSYLDAYEQFRTDIYKYMGMNAEDANVNGTGKAWYKDGSFQDKGPMIEKYRDDLIKSGYDGIFIVGTKYDAKTMGKDNTQYVAFGSNQIKLTTNEHPTSDPDVRYSVDADDDGPNRHSPSVSKYKTERQARVDNLLRVTQTRRLYTSVDARNVVKEIEGVMVLGDGSIVGHVGKKYRKATIDLILDTLRNAPEGGRMSRCLLCADYILATAIGEDYYEEEEVDIHREHYSEIVRIGNMVREIGISISDHELAEIRHRYDKSARSISNKWLVKRGSSKDVWTTKNGKRVKVSTDGEAFDNFWEEMAEYRPDLFDKEKDPLTGWMDFFDAYDEARLKLREKQNQRLFKEYSNEEDYNKIRKQIADLVYDSFFNKGVPDRDIENAVIYLYDDAEYYKRLAKDAQMSAAMANTATAEMSEKLRTATAEARRFARLVAKAEEEARLLSAFAKEQQGKSSRIVGYHSAAVLTNEAVARGIERLANNAKRSVIAPSTREAIVEFGKFYTKDNQLLSNVFDQQVRDDMDFIIGKHNVGLTADNVPLSEEEVQSVYNVMRHIRCLAERIDRYRGRGGQFESIPAAAGEIIDGIQKVEAYHRRNGKGLMRDLRWFRDKVSDPRVIIRDLVGYDNNSKLLELFDALTDGETRAHKMEASMYRILEDFRKNNKAYMKSLDNTTVTIGDAELTKGEAMQIALLWMQPYSRKTLESSGFWTTNKDGTRKKHRALTLEDMMAFVQTFSKADQDFIDTALKVYSYAKQAHIEADIGIKGFSEIDTDSDSIYVHVQVAEESLPTTAENKQGFNVSAANLGIAKSRTGAHLALNVKNALGALLEYIPQEAKYCFLAVPAKNFELVYNYNVNRTLDANKQSASNTYDIRTVKSTLAGIYSTADKYLSDMLQDGQGFTERESGELARWAQKVYSRFVTAGLGLNVKVMITQFASYPAAGIYISPKNLAKAMFAHYERGMFADMDKFSDWAYSRNAEGGAALAAAALGEDRLDAILQKTTAGINAIDRFTIGRLWIACQYEVESKKGLAFGTDANKRAAAKLLEEVGRATQPNYTAFERSALQRSNNIFAIAFKPFTSVATKYCSRLFEAVGEFRAIGFLKRQGVQLSAAQIRARKTNVLRVAASLATANMMYALMVEFMKHILNRDLKDKDGNEIGFVQDLLQEFASASISMFPIVRDIVDKLCFGYDIDDYATSALNDVVDAVTAMGSLLDQAMHGENVDSHKLSRTLKQSLLSIATFTGVPARNTYNLVYGLTKRFDEAAAARWDDAFYATSIADVNKVITNGDDRKAEALVDLVIDQRIEGLSADVNKKLYELYKQYASGENIDLINCLPKAVNKTFNYNNETITMNAKELKQFRATYNKASEAIEALIAQDVFDGLKAEEQAQAIKTITDYYYYKAQYDVMEMEYDCSKHKVLLFADTMDTDVFALAVGSCKYIEGRKNKAGQTIAGSKEAAIKKWLKQLPLSRMEKIILLAYLGYSVKDYAPLLRKYAASLGWSKAQQTSFLEACGVA